MVSRAYQDIADRAGVPRVAALPVDPARARAVSGVAPVDSGAIFDSPEYRSRGGPGSTGDWRERHSNWRRNLLEGLAETPDVAAGAHLLRLENARDIALPAGISVAWTKAVGLDRDADQFGLAIIDNPAPLLELARSDARVRLYHPISEKLREGA